MQADVAQRACQSAEGWRRHRELVLMTAFHPQHRRRVLHTHRQIGQRRQHRGARLAASQSISNHTAGGLGAQFGQCTHRAQAAGGACDRQTVHTLLDSARMCEVSTMVAPLARNCPRMA